jgi:outer membrane usher protein
MRAWWGALLIAVCLAGTPARPGVAEVPELLLLDVRINSQTVDGVVRAYRFADGRVALPVDVWTEARLRPAGRRVGLPNGHDGYLLQAVRGMTFVLNRTTMTLEMIAPAAAFEASAFDLGRGGAPPPTPAAPGAYVNYDVTGTHGAAGASNYGGFVEAVAFNHWGSAVTGTALRDDRGALVTSRTETFFERDTPGSMEALVLGDSISSDGGWSRPARYGGIRFARDFLLRPGYITFPLPTLTGSAVLPSVVDILVNGQRQGSGPPLVPGPFTLNNVPLVTGAGDINLVVRDIRGAETVFTQSFYTAPRLLETGLSDFSLEAGSLRRNFGLDSNAYGPSFAASTYRYGINESLTRETRVELQKDRFAGGVEFDGLIESYASYRAAAGGSGSGGEHGGHYLFGLERTTPHGGASLQFDRFDPGYSAFGALPGESRPRQQISAGVGVKLSARIAAAANYLTQSSWNAAPFRSAALNVNFSLPGNLYMGAYAVDRLGASGGWSGALTLLIPLSAQRIATVGVVRDPAGRLVDAVEEQQALPQGPGVGWRLRASDDAGQRAQASVAYNMNAGGVTADLNQGAGTDAVRVGARGSVGLLQGLPFASRYIGDGSFAVVKVGDVADVPVYRSNQLVATTNARGVALVPFLLPYQANQISIDSERLPLNVEVRDVVESPVPYARSGVFVDFAAVRSRNAMVILRQADGDWVPAGARVSLSETAEQFLVGLRGEVYVMGVKDQNSLTVQWNEHACVVPLTVPATSTQGDDPRIGPLTCVARHE